MSRDHGYDEYLWADSDNRIYLSALKDQVSDEFINDATVTAQVYDGSDTAVGGQVALTARGSGGNYDGVLPTATVDDMTLGTWYYIVITAAKSGNVQKWRLPRRLRWKET